MGTVIDLGAERKRRRATPRAARRAAPPAGPTQRTATAELDLAIRRLTPLVRRATEDGRNPELETELLAAIGAVATGLPDEAMRRLEALTVRLGGETAPPPTPAGTRPKERSARQRSRSPRPIPGPDVRRGADGSDRS